MAVTFQLNDITAAIQAAMAIATWLADMLTVFNIHTRLASSPGPFPAFQCCTLKSQTPCISLVLGTAAVMSFSQNITAVLLYVLVY